MKIIMGILVVILLMGSGYAKSPTEVQKNEAIRRARECALASSPPMDQTRTYEAYAIYLRAENAWVVDFIDPDTRIPDMDYMVRLEATSGKYPELLRGSDKLKYKLYFQNMTPQEDSVSVP